MLAFDKGIVVARGVFAAPEYTDREHVASVWRPVGGESPTDSTGGTMKRLTTIIGVICAIGAMAGAPAALGGTGNGVPPGPHFNLNIHGVANGQGFSGSNQNDIFVPLYGSCKITLVQNPLVSPFNDSFGVLQPNCVASPNVAQFALPAPCAIDATTGLCSGSTTYYSVWARALAKPGGWSSATTCATDPVDGLVCSLNSYVAVRGTGGSKFANETSALLFLTTCNTVTGKTTSTPIFSQNYQNYFWEYDNTGLRLLQLRFYQVPSPVPLSTTCPAP
jgi:hypothetical protein